MTGEANTAAAAAQGAGRDSAVASCCPRCGAGFHCGINGATPCACSTVQLSAAQLASLRQRCGDCLCLACLLSLPALP